MTDRIIDLTIRHFTNQLTDVEKKELNAWINECEDNLKWYNENKEIWYSSTTTKEMERFDSERAFALFCSRVEAAERKEKRTRLIPLRSFFRAAAALVLVVAMSYGVYNIVWGSDQAMQPDIVVAVPNGSKAQIQLPDGSIAYINGGSRISYSPTYGQENRNISLSGEAFFDVRKDAERSFVVKSASTIVTVKGTKFNVRDYETEDNASVTLVEGSVVMSTTSNLQREYQLVPGQQITVDKRKSTVEQQACDADSECGWTQGRLSLNGKTLTDIVRKLQHIYLIKISVQCPNPDNLHFYGEFDTNVDGIFDVLDVLSETKKIHYRKQNDRIIIY